MVCRWSMVLDMLLMTSGLLLISFAPSTSLLLLGRFITGHSSGSNIISGSIFVSEISHPDLRGTTRWSGWSGVQQLPFYSPVLFTRPVMSLDSSFPCCWELLHHGGYWYPLSYYHRPGPIDTHWGRLGDNLKTCQGCPNFLFFRFQPWCLLFFHSAPFSHWLLSR